jgi:hypothetical protein
MPARPIWRGHLRLALVSCPVALWNARHDRSSIRFNTINPATGNRIKMVRRTLKPERSWSGATSLRATSSAKTNIFCSVTTISTAVDGCLDPRISGAGCLNWWGETGSRGALAERHVRYCWMVESVSPGAPQGLRG